MNARLIRLRPASLSDVPLLVELEHTCFATDRLSLRSFRRLAISLAAAVLVAETPSGIMGCLVLLFRSRSSIGRIYSLAVHPDSRRRGLASRLLAGGERLAARRGAAAVRLEVREDNLAAAHLYRHNGYRTLDRRAGYYEDGAAALRLEKKIGGGRP